MGALPHQPAWTAGKAIDGNTDQSYLSNSCAITDVDRNRNTYTWWKVWLQKKFNVAYIEIYFRSDSKYLIFLKAFKLEINMFQAAHAIISINILFYHMLIIFKGLYNYRFF